MKKILSLSLLLVGVTGLHAAEPMPPAWAQKLKTDLEKMAVELDAKLRPWPVPDHVVRVEEYGAVADGQTVNTAAIQKALDACSAAGGGTVLLSKGDYVSGTIDLRSGVMLEIAQGSRLLGSTNLADYPDRIAKRTTVMDTHMKMNQSLIFAEGVERVGLRGPGTIDFRGTKENFPGQSTIGATPGRPFGMRFIDSKQIVVENITIKDSPCWTHNYLNCEDLIFQKMTVDSHSHHNNDGIDIDGCRRLIMRNCFISSGDDGLCFKGAGMKPTEDVFVENCTFYSAANALKIGTDTQGDFRRIFVRNVRLGGVPDNMRTLRGHTSSSGITLATVDGGDVEDIVISGATIHQVRAPVFIAVGDRGRVMPDMPKPKVGVLQRVIIEDITGDTNRIQGSFISGMRRHPVDQVLISNFKVGMEGGGTTEMIAQSVPRTGKAYPDAGLFSSKGLPSYGFFVRQASNVTFQNVTVTPAKPDARPSFFIGEDVTNITLNGALLAAGAYTANGTVIPLPSPTPTPSPEMK